LSIGEMLMTAENGSTRSKTCTSDTSSTNRFHMGWSGIEPGPPRWEAKARPVRD